MDFSNLTKEQQEVVNVWHDQNDKDEEFNGYCDNHRYAVKGNQEQEKEYERRRGEGCCGAVDLALPCPDGSILLYGFNYGH